MAILSAQDLQFAHCVSRLLYCNPFLPERIALERTALGNDFDASGAEWNLRGDVDTDHPNVQALLARAARVTATLGSQLSQLSPAQLDQYRDVVLFLAYYRSRDDFDPLLEAPSGEHARMTASFARFKKELSAALPPPHFDPTPGDIAHLFACFFQVKRAIHCIFRNIIGLSVPVARLRAAVWQSVFTHDMRRYRTVLYPMMNNITTLITGPSGTGKELVARGIALSRYIPYNAERNRFWNHYAETYYPINLSALSPTLIESELFGHARGAFTGATADRSGWFEQCDATGTVFLDEIGDLDPAIQVKLLRVLDTGTFHRIGDGVERQFDGKVVAATNRTLVDEMHDGRFREDLYYRLCSDVIATPSLRERLADRPDELTDLVLFIARRHAGAQAEPLAKEVLTCIRTNIGPDYAWPGNVRELEQCVRNVLVRGTYAPQAVAPTTFSKTLGDDAAAGDIPLDDLITRYCTLVYEQTGSFEGTARKLGIDRRTVKSKVDLSLLAAQRQ